MGRAGASANQSDRNLRSSFSPLLNGMMYYVNCSCVPSEAGGPICHTDTCEFRQLPISCVDAITTASPDPSRNQLITVVSHPGPLVPMAAPGLQSTEAVPTGARIIFQPSPGPVGSLPREPVDGSTDTSRAEGEYREQVASPEENSPGHTKLVLDWSESHVKVLLELYEKERPKFLTKGLVRKRLWGEIAQKVNRITGLQLQGFHCENKWKVLMRGYRRAEKDFGAAGVDEEQFKKAHPLFEQIRTILSKDPIDEYAVTARDVQKLSRESRMVWRPQDTKSLLNHYGNFRKRQKNPNLTLMSWERIARLIRQDIPSFAMSGSHCYSRFRFLRIKYQRAMLLCKDETSRWPHCPMFNELHAVLREDPLPSEVPLTPSQIAKKKKERRANEPDDEERNDGFGLPSVIQLEPTSRKPQEEFTAYLAKLVDGLAVSLKDRAMQDILGYVFNFRKKIRLAKSAKIPGAAAS
ncbi:uncharacterized protein LOC100902893 [Galendromus occidentalis]|uniref:Uncharacterized protein LOC100902893 n=1 Tax=Galendromus occidentalis TaxID=34638 RepID=A0AAJ7SFU4_9ACAR|nr:uncharacterized protein LOC100902893 [Galendromus occidentalis]